jgi:hypothetical protein
MPAAANPVQKGLRLLTTKNLFYALVIIPLTIVAFDTLSKGIIFGSYIPALFATVDFSLACAMIGQKFFFGEIPETALCAPGWYNRIIHMGFSSKTAEKEDSCADTRKAHNVAFKRRHSIPE